MPAFHSSFNGVEGATVAGLPVLPLRSDGGAGSASPDSDHQDIVDEAIRVFRANVFFKHVDVDGKADRLLTYLTLFVHLCLKTMAGAATEADAAAKLNPVMLSTTFALPGSADFPLAGIMTAPAAAEKSQLVQYLKQLREATGKRLLHVVYNTEGVEPKFWLAFAKRKPFNRELNA